MMSMMGKKKKFILLQHFLFWYVVSHGAREKTHSVITLVFLYSLWWSNRKNSFCYNVIFCMLSMMEQEKKFIVTKLFFVCYLWWSKRKHSFCYNIILLRCLWWSKRQKSFSYHITFGILPMMEKEKKLTLL